MINKLYEFTLKVRPSQHSDQPFKLQGAYVTCYASAADYQTAIKNAVVELSSRNFNFEDLINNVNEINPLHWDRHIKKTWPEYVDDFPSTENMIKMMNGNGVVFGPFIGF